MARLIFPHTVRRAVAAAGVASLAIVGLSVPAGGAQAGVSATVINTYPQWDGTTSLAAFGHPDTATYGQVITIDSGLDQVRKFKFSQSLFGGSGTMIYRCEVYGWDGTMATDFVWESEPKSFVPTGTYQPTKCRPKGQAPVVAGQQYVLFLTVSKDYEETAPGLSTQWGCIYADVYPGGGVVYINDTGDESLWTTVPWSQIPSFDFAFKARVA